jgi:hypothetical protein
MQSGPEPQKPTKKNPAPCVSKSLSDPSERNSRRLCGSWATSSIFFSEAGADFFSRHCSRSLVSLSLREASVRERGIWSKKKVRLAHAIRWPRLCLSSVLPPPRSLPAGWPDALLKTSPKM